MGGTFSADSIQGEYITFVCDVGSTAIGREQMPIGFPSPRSGKKQISPRQNGSHGSGKAKTFATRRNGGSGEKQIYRGFARMSADQKQNSNCSFWCSDHRITGSTDHQISISVIGGKV